MKYGDDWKKVADEMEMKNRREAILEFLRIPLDIENDSKYLLDYTTKTKQEPVDLK